MKALIIFIVLITLGGSFLYFSKDENMSNIEIPKATSSPTTQTDSVEITAKFRIVTNGTTRVFSDKKYHNQSLDVYIDPENTTFVVVKKSGTTWSDFFKTLPSPMKVEKDCLTTGTGQTFCTNEKQKLVFKLNDIEDSEALTKEIKNLDYLLVEYK